MRTSLQRSSAAAFLVALVALFLPEAATARTQEPGTAVVHHAAEARSAQSGTEYWTPERRAAAVPRALGEVEVPDSVRPQAASDARTAPTVLAEPTSPTASPLAAPLGAAAVSHATVGKVFFTVDGAGYVCSASVVSSAGKNMVFTAGHCLHDGNGGSWAEKFTFYPGFENNTAPYGGYEFETLVTTVGWAEDGDFDYDFGIALMGQFQGYEVVEVVGGNGVWAGYSGTQNFLAMGYSAAGAYDGMTLQVCDAQAEPEGGQYEMDCTNQTGGASGGPWVENTGSVPYVSGVNSNADDRDNPTVIRSPHFGSWVIDLYNEYAQG